MICQDKSSKLGYPRFCWNLMLCKFLQTYTGIAQDNRVADAARRV